MYRKTPSKPDEGNPSSDAMRGYLQQARDHIHRLLARHPLHFFTAMITCILLSGALAFTVMRIDIPAAIPDSPKPPASGAGSTIGSIVQTYGTLQEISRIQREIQAIIEKDSLGTADSIRLIDALQRFEQMQQNTIQHKNSTP